MGIRIVKSSRLGELEAYINDCKYSKHCVDCPGLNGEVHHPSYEITTACNLNCIFCYAKSSIATGKAPKPGYYGDEKPKVITVSQYGEPTIIGLSKLEHLFRLLRKKFGNIRIDLQTNGVLLKKCVDADIIMISLSASNRENYAKITGKDEFLNVLKAIEISSAEKDTIIRCVFLPGINDRDILEIAKIAKKYDTEYMIQPCSIHPGIKERLIKYDFGRDTLYDYLDVVERANNIADVRVPGCLISIVKNMLEYYDFEDLVFSRRSISNKVPEIRRDWKFSFDI